MTSGVKLDDEIKDYFIDVKSNHKYKTVLLKMKDSLDGLEFVESFVTHTFDELVALVKDNYSTEPLFILHDFQFDGGRTSCLSYITWCSDDAKIKKRMVFASTSSEAKKAADGYKLFAHATDLDELKEIADKAKAKATV